MDNTINIKEKMKISKHIKTSMDAIVDFEKSFDTKLGHIHFVLDQIIRGMDRQANITFAMEGEIKELQERVKELEGERKREQAVREKFINKPKEHWRTGGNE